MEESMRETPRKPNTSLCQTSLNDFKTTCNLSKIDEKTLVLNCLCCGNLELATAHHVGISPLNIDSTHTLLDSPEQVPVFVENLMNPTSIYKMRKPSKPLRELEEEEDMLVYQYRCAECQSCQTCLEADKTKTISVKEEEEQKLIQQAVYWDRVYQAIYCSYPWITEPNEAMTRWWGKNKNESQAYN